MRQKSNRRNRQKLKRHVNLIKRPVDLADKEQLKADCMEHHKAS